MNAKALLRGKGIEFEEISVDGQPELREEMMRRSGRHTVPQIWIGDEHIGGCDELFALERSDSLDIMIQRTQDEASELDD